MTIKQPTPSKPSAYYLTVEEDAAGQRIDNFLIRHLKGVPKSRIYRMVRSGEVRINKKRIGPFYRVQESDRIRIPPVKVGEKAKSVPPSEDTQTLLTNRILYEDEYLLVLNKPSGMAVHGGSTVRIGVIEALKTIFPQHKGLELAHRLDSETSGCLIIAKKRSVLRELHTLFREGKIRKIYWALTKGAWKPEEYTIKAPLKKFFLQGGERVVKVSSEGKVSHTVVEPLSAFKNGSLVEIKLFTGRTHQIRVHTQHLGHPIAGDPRYGDKEYNQGMSKMGLKRLFLHAKSIDFTLPKSQKHIHIEAPLDHHLSEFIEKLKAEGSL